MKARLLGLLVVVSSVLFAALPAHAMLHIVLDSGTFNPVPIAVTDLVASDPNSAQLGRQISDVVAADLERSGLFRPIYPILWIEH